MCVKDLHPHCWAMPEKPVPEKQGRTAKAIFVFVKPLFRVGRLAYVPPAALTVCQHVNATEPGGSRFHGSPPNLDNVHASHHPLNACSLSSAWCAWCAACAPSVAFTWNLRVTNVESPPATTTVSQRSPSGRSAVAQRSLSGRCHPECP